MGTDARNKEVTSELDEKNQSRCEGLNLQNKKIGYGILGKSHRPTRIRKHAQICHVRKCVFTTLW